jgi:hypothetical protein
MERTTTFETFAIALARTPVSEFTPKLRFLRFINWKIVGGMVPLSKYELKSS